MGFDPYTHGSFIRWSPILYSEWITLNFNEWNPHCFWNSSPRTFCALRIHRITHSCRFISYAKPVKHTPLVNFHSCRCSLDFHILDSKFSSKSLSLSPCWSKIWGWDLPPTVSRTAAKCRINCWRSWRCTTRVAPLQRARRMAQWWPGAPRRNGHKTGGKHKTWHFLCLKHEDMMEN